MTKRLGPPTTRPPQTPEWGRGRGFPRFGVGGGPAAGAAQGSDDRTVRLWDVKPGARPPGLEGPARPPVQAAQVLLFGSSGNPVSHRQSPVYLSDEGEDVLTLIQGSQEVEVLEEDSFPDLDFDNMDLPVQEAPTSGYSWWFPSILKGLGMRALRNGMDPGATAISMRHDTACEIIWRMDQLFKKGG